MAFLKNSHAQIERGNLQPSKTTANYFAALFACRIALNPIPSKPPQKNKNNTSFDVIVVIH